MHLNTAVFFFLSTVFALEPVSPALASPNDDSPHPVVLVLSTPAPQPPRPYLELRHLDLDPRQIQPAAVGAPAQAAAGATIKPAAGVAAPVAPVANPVTTAPAAPVATPATTAVAAPAGAAVPAAAAPAAADGLIGQMGDVPINKGPATALTTAPSPKSGVIGMGTLTGQIGIVKTQEAKSEAGLAMDKRFGSVSSWPAAFKIGASVLLGTALGVGILL